MIDLTPLDVRKKRGDFRRGLRGYDPEEVDTFMDLVAERFEELVRENLALSEKAIRIEAQLKALEGRESAVQEALVTAQKLREDVRDQSRRDADSLKDQALREAEILKSEAQGEIARRLGEAEGLILERQRALEELERNRRKFLKGFRGLLEREMDAVEVEEARRPLEDTPLELDFRSSTPSGEEADEAPGGFDSQIMTVPETLEAPPEEEGDSELEGADLEAEAEAEAFESEMAAEEEAEVLETDDQPEADWVDPGLEAEEGWEPSPEWTAGLVVAAEEGGFEDHPSPVEGVSGEAHDPYDVADLAPDTLEEPEGDADSDQPPTGEEPKWLFSLLKREEQEREGEE